MKDYERNRSWPDYPGICLEKLKAVKKKIRATGLGAEILTRNLQNVKQEYKTLDAITVPRLRTNAHTL
jgi:hypothetical protein